MDFIFKGRVTVNGRVVVEPSTPIDCAKDKVCVDGAIIETKRHEYVLLNKPQGYVTTVKDRHAEKTVLDLLPKNLKHLYLAGRLDKDTVGLLLLTNDGDVAYKLTHPSFHVDKAYIVTIKGRLKENDKIHLEKGVFLGGERTAPAKIMHLTDFFLSNMNFGSFGKYYSRRKEKVVLPSTIKVSKEKANKSVGDKTEFHMTIHEGRKRQIRQMLSGLGYWVVNLERISQGPLTLGNLKIGQWRALQEKEITALHQL